jgi:L-alanine-DL-glutamate epimerase-like enolase superfamily enzyme
VALIEQPLPAGRDETLALISASDRGDLLFCADESVHTIDDLDTIASRYQAINIKLDKAGGLTAALQLKSEALARGLKIMIGCMVGTSLAMAPALLLAVGADFVDLDGPLLLARDREPGLTFDGSVIQPFGAELWG